MSARNLENRLLYRAAVVAGAICLILTIKSLAVSELAQSVAHLTQAGWSGLNHRTMKKNERGEKSKKQELLG